MLFIQWQWMKSCTHTFREWDVRQSLMRTLWTSAGNYLHGLKCSKSEENSPNHSEIMRTIPNIDLNIKDF